MSTSPSTSDVPGQKRIRVYTDDDDESAAQGSGYEAGSPIHQRACVRCKNLKVKCEVKSINEVVSEPCRRCKNAGYECVLPGTKKRKAPPKRGDLMQTIQEQAAHIRRLQEQLVALRNGQPLPPLDTRGSNSDSYREASANDAPEPEVRNWIISAVSEQSEDEGSTYEEEDEELGSSYGMTAVSQASSGDSQRGIPSRVLRSITTTIPSEASPLGMMASLSIQASSSSGPKRGGRGSDHVEEEGVGLTEPLYFEKGPAPNSLRGTVSSVNQKLSPSIFTKKLITTQDAEQLFQIYYEHINPAVFLLDPALYSAQQTCLRSSFLFTVVCAISSRFMPGRPELYSQLMEHALIAAGVTLSGGGKDVEIVYAYILLALYPRPQRRWEDDRSWWYLGIAVRVSMDLNLHHPPQVIPSEEKKAREALNRTRAGIACWTWDRVFNSFTGKDPTELGVDSVKLRGEEWFRVSQWNVLDGDATTSAMIAVLKCMYKHRQKIYTDPSAYMGLNLNQDFRVLGVEADAELTATQAAWTRHLRELLPDNAANRFRIATLAFYASYFRLRFLNFCLTHTSEAQHAEDPTMLHKCLAAALAVMRCFRQDLIAPGKSAFFKHAPDCNSLIVTIAGTMLVKLLRPPFVNFFRCEESQQMQDEVRNAITILSSSEIAVDEQHAPSHHARFLTLVSQPPSSESDEPSTPIAPPLGGGYGMSYPTTALSPTGPLPMNSAFEPALMDLYNSSHGAGAWSYAPASASGMYGSAAPGPAAPDARGWYPLQQQEFFPSNFAFQDAMHYPPATAPTQDTGAHSPWTTSTGQWMNAPYASPQGQGPMYGYPHRQ